MAQGADVRPGMEVLGADGLHIGTVDGIEGDRIKLTRRDSNDGEHHFVALGEVTRVDAHVHVATTAAAMGLLAVAGVTAATADDGHAPFPPVTNRQVPGARPRGNFYLPWIVGLVGLVLLLLLFRSCAAGREAQDTVIRSTGASVNAPGAAPTTSAVPAGAVTLPGGQSLTLVPNTLGYDLQRYLASDQPAPRTFSFDRLNFDTGSAAIRADDRPTIDALAQILAAYPNARVTITGYADARGEGRANAQLGARRAQAVAAALAAKGVGRDRVATASGGEGNPAGTNATAGGRFENRRTELTVDAK